MVGGFFLGYRLFDLDLEPDVRLLAKTADIVTPKLAPAGILASKDAQKSVESPK